MSAAAWVGVGIAALGTALGFSAGRKQDARFAEMAAQQYEMDKLNYAFQWQEAEDAHTYHLEDLDIAQWNLANERTYRNQTAINEWIDNDKQRLFDYNNQVDAYNASVQAYETQLNVNNLASDLAIHGARLQYQDTLTKLGFELEDLNINQNKAEVKIGRKRVALAQQRDTAIKSSRTQRAAIKQALETKKAELALKLEQQQLSGLEAEGKAKSMGRSGRSARKNWASILAKTNRLEYEIESAMRRSRSQSDLDIIAINQKLESLGDSIDLQDTEIIDELYNTRVDVEFSTQQLNEQLRSENYAFNAQEQKRKLDKYGADIQATKMLAASPVLAPELSKPLELPTPKYATPRAPRKGPEPRKYASSAGHGLAALGSGMASLGAAVASIPD